MRECYCLGLFLSLGLFANPAIAFSSPHSTNLVAQIKPNPTIGSKPAIPFPSVKLASVTFLPDEKTLIKFNCPDGWRLDEGVCVVNECEGFPYTNSTETQNCKSSESCKSGTEYKYRCKGGCQDGLTEIDGKCTCNPESFPYSEETPCINGYFDEEETGAETCSEITATGTRKKYYKGCKCYPSWETCSGSHQEGFGKTCVSYGTTYYETCACEESFNKQCTDGRAVRPDEYCQLYTGATKYFDECYYCEINKGEVYDLEEYWCDHEWVEFPAIGNLFEAKD